MKKRLIMLVAGLIANTMDAQQPLTPEKLWELGRVGTMGLTQDKSFVLFSVAYPNVKENSFRRELFKLSVKGGVPIPISEEELKRETTKFNATKDKKLVHKPVKINKVFASDFYNDLDKSTGQNYKSLDHRHWDKWMDGAYNPSIHLSQ